MCLKILRNINKLMRVSTCDYFTYASYFRHLDYSGNACFDDCATLEEWHEMIGLLFNHDAFDEIIENTFIKIKDRNDLKNFRLSLFQHMGYIQEYESQDVYLKANKEDTVLVEDDREKIIDEKLALFPFDPNSMHDSEIFQPRTVVEESRKEKNELHSQQNTNTSGQITNTGTVSVETSKKNELPLQQNTNNSGKITSTNTSPHHYLARPEYAEVLSILNDPKDYTLEDIEKEAPSSMEQWNNKSNKTKFAYDTSKYPKHDDFVPYEAWKRKTLNKDNSVIDQANSSTCIHSTSLNFTLSYKEVYGRILGTKSEIIDHSELRWLNDTVIDSFIQVMVYRSVKKPIAYMSKNPEKELPRHIQPPLVYVANTYFHRHFTGEHYDMEGAIKCFYTTKKNSSEELPNHFETNTQFLIPWNISNLHWILFFVDIINKEVTVFDSCQANGGAVDDGVKKGMMVCLWFLITLYTKIHQQEDDTDLNVEDFRWVLYGKKLYPQQDNSYDCGVFVLMAIYSILFDKYRFYGQFDAKRFRGYIFSLLINMEYLEKNEKLMELSEVDDGLTESDSSSSESSTSSSDSDSSSKTSSGNNINGTSKKYEDEDDLPLSQLVQNKKKENIVPVQKTGKTLNRLRKVQKKNMGRRKELLQGTKKNNKSKSSSKKRKKRKEKPAEKIDEKIKEAEDLKKIIDIFFKQ